MSSANHPFFQGIFVNFLDGGFIPFQKYSSNWIISPGRGENKKCLKPPPRKIQETLLDFEFDIEMGPTYLWHVSFFLKDVPIKIP